jgi:hypothetical protein
MSSTSAKEYDTALAQRQGDKISEITTGIDKKEVRSKKDKVKGWMKSARQWTMFGDSPKPEQERHAFYREWLVSPCVLYD